MCPNVMCVIFLFVYVWTWYHNLKSTLGLRISCALRLCFKTGAAGRIHPFHLRLFSQRSLTFETPTARGKHTWLSSLPSSRCVMFCTSAVTAFSIASAHRAFDRSSCRVGLGTGAPEYYPGQVLDNVGWGLQSGQAWWSYSHHLFSYINGVVQGRSS